LKLLLFESHHLKMLHINIPDYPQSSATIIQKTSYIYSVIIERLLS
jgi:hypothetical protein